MLMSLPGRHFAAGWLWHPESFTLARPQSTARAVEWSVQRTRSMENAVVASKRGLGCAPVDRSGRQSTRAGSAQEAHQDSEGGGATHHGQGRQTYRRGAGGDVV